MPKIKGIKQKKMWAIFAPNGELQVRSIAYTKKQAELQTPRYGCGTTIDDYYKEGYVPNKILVDIKLLD